MDSILKWLIHNKEWLFSGIGIVFLGMIFKTVFYILNVNKTKPTTNQIQKSGKNSVNIQSGQNTNIASDDKE